MERWQKKAGIISQKEGECFESEVSNLLNAMGVLLVAF